MFQRTQLVTEHALLAFPDGRQAVPRAVICKSDVLKRIVGVPAAQAVVAALLPRRALQLWSLHVQRQAQQDNSIDDLCTVVRVADFLADRGSLLSAGASLAARLLHQHTIQPEQVGQILDTLTENQALAVLQAHAAKPAQFRAHYLKQPAVLVHHPQLEEDCFRPLYQLLTALPPSHERLALLAHTTGIEGSACLHVGITEPAATLQALRIAAKHFHGLTSLSFRPWLHPVALCQALLCTLSLPNLLSLNLSGMHVSQQASNAIAGALLCLPRLQVLKLASCGLRGGAARVLFEVLQALGDLEQLVLRHNDVQESSAGVLAAQFMHLPALQSLDVASTRLSAAAAHQIVANIHHLTDLRTLDVRGNPLHTTPAGTSAAGAHQGLTGGSIIGGAVAFGAAHILPLGIARSLACKLAALPHFENILLDQHRRITHAGHMHATLDPHPHPNVPVGVSPTEPGVGLLTALSELQPYMHAAYFQVDLDATSQSSGDSVMHDAQAMFASAGASSGGSMWPGSVAPGSEKMPASINPSAGRCMHNMHAAHCRVPLSHLTELQLHLVKVSGQGSALAEGLAGLSSLRRLRVTVTNTVADSELSRVVSALSKLQSLTLLKWHHEGGRGTAGYAGSFSEALWNLPDLANLEFDFALEDPRHAGVVGDAFGSLRKLDALHLGFCTDSLMSSLSPLLPTTLQHMSVNAICQRGGLAAFCMHAPQLSALNSLSLAGQSCSDTDMLVLAAYIPQLSALTMLYITLLRSSVTVENSTPEHKPSQQGMLVDTSVRQPLQDVSMTCAEELDGVTDAHVEVNQGGEPVSTGPGDPTLHGEHACVAEVGATSNKQKQTHGTAARVIALEALARSIALLPRLQSLRLGLDVWTEGMANVLFMHAGQETASAMHASTQCTGAEQLSIESSLDDRGSSFDSESSMHECGVGSEDPPAQNLAMLTDVNFFLPIGPAFRMPQHRTDKLLPPCTLFPRALCACSHMESLEAEHFVLTRTAVAPLYTLTVLPHLLVLDLQAMHMSVGVARKLARALHGIALPCLTFLRLDIITVAATEPQDTAPGHGNGVGAGRAAMHHASFGLVGDADTHSTTVDEDSDAEDTAVDEASHKAREGKAGAVCSGGANAEGTAVASEQESSATSCAPKRQKCDSELAAVVHLLPPLPSLVTLHLTSRRSDYVGWKAAARAWSSGDSAQRAERVQHAEHFSQSLNAILAFSTRLQTLQLSTSQLPDSALHAVGSLAGLPSLTELCLGESTCGATTAGALHWQLRGHTALADVKLSGCRLKDPGARAVADWLRTLPAVREVTFDNIGLCPNGCVDLDQVITDLKANVRFTQQSITCVYGERT